MKAAAICLSLVLIGFLLGAAAMTLNYEPVTIRMQKDGTASWKFLYRKRLWFSNRAHVADGLWIEMEKKSDSPLDGR
jgi:hypothetical protein